MPESLPRTVAIFGPGLLGGSMALALREKAPDTQIKVWARRDSAFSELESRGIKAECSTDIGTVCRGADFIVLCTPVATMPELGHQIAASKLNENCIITDVGSVKSSVVAQLETIFGKTSAQFIGSHPMAGSECAGLAAARADLFDGAACIITPTLFSTEAALRGTRSFWQMLGTRVLEMTPEEHDAKIARISHLPHLVAAAVTQAALKADPSAALCAGNGFRDATRIAAGDPDLWTGIARENRTEILAALHDAQDRLSDLVAMLENMDDKALRHFLAEAKELRDQVP